MTFKGCVRIITQLRGNASTPCEHAIKATQLMLRRAGLCAHSLTNSQNSLRTCRKRAAALFCAQTCSESLRCLLALCEAYGNLAAQPAIATASEQRAHSRVVTRHICLRSGVWQRGHGPRTAAAHVRLAHFKAVSTLC